MNAYDSFAWLYNRYWAEPLLHWEMPALNRLLLNGLPAGARILDICCGTGHLARELVARGWSVTGVDNSFGMLEIAQANVPNADFRLQNIAALELPTQYDAAVCTFDSINHIVDPATVLASFIRIARILKPGAPFLFDANTPEAYGERWDASATVIEPDHAFFLRGHYDQSTQRGHTAITMFRQVETWERTDVTLQQRPWTPDELRSFLEPAGFENIECWRAHSDLHMSGHYGIGRVYVRATAPK